MSIDTVDYPSRDAALNKRTPCPPPSTTIPNFETLDPVHRQPDGVADPKDQTVRAFASAKTFNKEVASQPAELDLEISKLVRGLGSTPKHNNQARHAAEHSSRAPMHNSPPSKSTTSVLGEHSKQRRVVPSTSGLPTRNRLDDPREVLAQLGQMLRPYVVNSDNFEVASGNSNYANLCIDDEISNTLDSLTSSFTAEGFLANAKILRKVVKHHNAILKAHGNVAARHKNKIAITQAQLDTLAARVDVLEQERKDKNVKVDKGKGRAEDSVDSIIVIE